MIRETFLEQFNPVAHKDWIEIVPGRAAVLQLNGPNGSLDIYSLYFHTGANSHGRSHVRARVSHNIREISGHCTNDTEGLSGVL